MTAEDSRACGQKNRLFHPLGVNAVPSISCVVAYEERLSRLLKKS